MSIETTPEFIDRSEAFLGRPGQPVLQVLPDLRVIVQTSFLYNLLNHILIIAQVARPCAVNCSVERRGSGELLLGGSARDASSVACPSYAGHEQEEAADGAEYEGVP